MSQCCKHVFKTLLKRLGIMEGWCQNVQSPQAPLSCFLPQVTLGSLCWLIFSFASLHSDIQSNPTFRHPHNLDTS